jgi:hypothetical protein
MSIFRKCTKTVLNEAISTCSNSEFLIVDGQTPNSIKLDEVDMSRVRAWINSNDGFVSE